jgi:hypothetical protein
VANTSLATSRTRLRLAKASLRVRRERVTDASLASFTWRD